MPNITQIETSDGIKKIDYENLANQPILSNPNLLENWYFGDPIDQRGGYVVPPGVNYYESTAGGTAAGTITSYVKVTPTPNVANSGMLTIDGKTYYCAWSKVVRGYVGAGYTIDRWGKTANGVVRLDSDRLTIEGMSGRATVFFQRIETSMYNQMIGRTVTFSVFTGDTVHSVTLNPDGSYTQGVLGDTGFMVGTQQEEGSGYIQIYTTVDPSISLKAAKLELGDKQTLAHQDAEGNWVLNDPPPNKALELAKCQRYALKLGGIVRYHSVQVTSNIIDFTIPTPITMRTNPALVTSDWVVTDLETMTTYTDFTFTVSGAHDTSNGFTIRATKANHGITRAMLGSASSSLTTIVSADL